MNQLHTFSSIKEKLVSREMLLTMLPGLVFFILWRQFSWQSDAYPLTEQFFLVIARFLSLLITVRSATNWVYSSILLNDKYPDSIPRFEEYINSQNKMAEFNKGQKWFLILLSIGFIVCLILGDYKSMTHLGAFMVILPILISFNAWHLRLQRKTLVQLKLISENQPSDIST